MKNRIFYALAAAAALGMLGTASADTIGNVTPGVIFGSGNANGSFTIDQNAGVELGLRGKLRHNPANSEQPANIFNSNGLVGPGGISTYSFDARAPFAGTAEWSFEWSVNTNFDGSNTDVGDPLAGTLGQYTYQLGIDQDASQGINFTIFDPINVVWWDHAIGNNSTVQGPGNPNVQTLANYANALDTFNVAQNSWKPSFGFIPSLNPLADATYNFYLAAFDANGLVTRTDIQIIVGNGGAPVVPIPGAAGLGLLGMGLVGYMRRRKNAVA